MIYHYKVTLQLLRYKDTLQKSATKMPRIDAKVLNVTVHKQPFDETSSIYKPFVAFDLNRNDDRIRCRMQLEQGLLDVKMKISTILKQQIVLRTRRIPSGLPAAEFERKLDEKVNQYCAYSDKHTTLHKAQLEFESALEILSWYC